MLSFHVIERKWVLEKDEKELAKLTKTSIACHDVASEVGHYLTFFRRCSLGRSVIGCSLLHPFARSLSHTPVLAHGPKALALAIVKT